MTLYYTDPLDPTVTWEASRTVQVGFVNEADRKNMSDLLYRRRALIFNLYRDHDKILHNLFEYPCVLRIMDYSSFQRIEDKIKKHLNDDRDPLEIVPIIVYGAGRDQLIDHIAIINGTTTHPKLISAYYLEFTKGF